jgi:hypothetical protein
MRFNRCSNTDKNMKISEKKRAEIKELVTKAYEDWASWALSARRKGKRKFSTCNQLEFTRHYLGFMLVNGLHPENLKRIQNFLRDQREPAVSDMFKVIFRGEESSDVLVYCRELFDIDFADIQALTGFDFIIIKNRGGKRWTRKSAKIAVDEIDEDLSYDYGEVFLNYTIKGSKLLMQTQMDSIALGMVRLGAVMNNNFLPEIQS